ncbi:MAG: cytidylate kinase [Solirubrobacteraceae bacterium]|nr:cytidylate kinase [Solirubrobacteraceae bacterium]
MLIAIDGPAGAGKSTVARAVARALGWTYLDSGAMYRAAALAALRGDPPPERIELGARVVSDGVDVTDAIRTPEVTARASEVAADPAVRERLVAMQRALIEAGNWVAEGRDIGTVVAPGAEVKVFLTASPQERARRRAEQEGRPVEEVLAEQEARDARDESREHSPLRAADDAVAVDTTGRSIDDVVAEIAALAKAVR